MKHRTINMMLDAWADHHENKPPEPDPDDLINAYQTQCKRMDEWEDSDRAWRLLVGVSMANKALSAHIGDREQIAKDEAHQDWLETRAGQTLEENHE